MSLEGSLGVFPKKPCKKNQFGGFVYKIFRKKFLNAKECKKEDFLSANVCGFQKDFLSLHRKDKTSFHSKMK